MLRRRGCSAPRSTRRACAHLDQIAHAASISSRRRRSSSRPRRSGATAGSSRARSPCGCSWRGSATAGGSCRAVSCASPTTPMRAPSACSGAAAPATPGCCRTSRWPKPRCCRRPTGSRSRAPPGRCRAGPPPICSGWRAMSNARRRRCAWCARWSTASPTNDDAARCGRPHLLAARRLGGGADRHAERHAGLVAAAALQRRDLDGALPRLVGAAHAAASVIRDRFSPDAWRALTDLVELINVPLDQGLTESALIERVNAALRIIASFSGLAQENMSQLAGWRYLELGRRIERAIATCRFVRQFAFDADPDSALDVLLELADSQITYRLRYVMVAARAPVIDLVVLDPNNPRSIAFQLARIEAASCRLAQRGDDGRLSPPEQIATALTTQLRTADAARSTRRRLVDVEAALMKLSDVVRRRPISPPTSAPTSAGSRSDDLRRPSGTRPITTRRGRACAPRAAADADRPA